MAKKAPLPYADVPRLIKKARGGVSYAKDHPRSLSVLERYLQLWRCVEYCAQERGAAVPESIAAGAALSSEADSNMLAQSIQSLGNVLESRERESPGSLRDYCDKKLSSTALAEAEHKLRRNVRTASAQRPCDQVSADTRTAAARILVALRNAVTHTGAMSTSMSARPYPEASELLDPVVCALYGELAGFSRAEVENAIRLSPDGPGPIF